MRTFNNFMWAVLPIFALTFAIGCKKGTDDEPNGPSVQKDSVIKLKDQVINASLAGDTYTMIYEIENAHAGEKISAEAAEAWVHDFNTGISGILSFVVDANPGTTPRQCLVTVKYRYAEDATFVVKQGAKTDASFTLENVTSTLFDYTVDVIPSNKTMPYIVMSAGPRFLDGTLDDIDTCCLVSVLAFESFESLKRTDESHTTSRDCSLFDEQKN